MKLIKLMKLSTAITALKETGKIIPITLGFWIPPLVLATNGTPINWTIYLIGYPVMLGFMFMIIYSILTYIAIKEGK